MVNHNFNGGVRWRLATDGIRIAGAVPETTRGEPQTVARVVNLPVAVTGRMIFVKCAETSLLAGSLTVTPNGLEVIRSGAAVGASTFTLLPGASAIFVGEATVGWHVYSPTYAGGYVAVGNNTYDFGVAGIVTRVAQGTPSGGDKAYDLPVAQGTGRVITIKCASASASNIVVTPNAGAGDLIDGAVTLTLAPGQAATIIDTVTLAGGNDWAVI